jgi:NTE family protein
MTALILAGGVALGSYQVGAYAALHAHGRPGPLWLAGSSIGAVNAVVIAGNPPERRVERLRALWNGADGRAREPRTPATQRWQHMESWASALRARLVGNPGHFRPRVPIPWETFKSLYDLAPLRERLETLVDFGMLNSGESRLTVATTDIETGELVLFDTARGDRITVDHVLASCGYLPEFAPLEIGGRLLGDGGLSANAPIEALLHERPERNIICFVVDLFPRDGVRPGDLETAAARKSDLVFANQTWLRLEAFCREEQLRAQIREASDEAQFGTTIYYLSYRPDPSEAGPERTFDYSARSTAARWRAGEADMRSALAIATPSNDARLIAIRRQPSDAASSAAVESGKVRTAAGGR